MIKEKKISRSRLSDYQKLEDVIGCKWSVAVMATISEGIIRPGEIERHIQGISTKVLSERFRKLTKYGLLRKLVYAESPPRTEYELTDKGRSLVNIIRQIHDLDQLGKT